MFRWMFNTSVSYHVMQQLFHICFHLLCIFPCILLLNKQFESWVQSPEKQALMFLLKIMFGKLMTWWPGHEGSHGISSHGICTVYTEHCLHNKCLICILRVKISIFMWKWSNLSGALFIPVKLWAPNGSGDVLVLSGTKPLPEPMLCRLVPTVWQ